MRPPAARPPGRKLPADLKRQVDTARSAQGTLTTHFGHLVDPNASPETRNRVPGRRKELWQMRKRKGVRPEGKEFRVLWRMPKGGPDGGRFAKRRSNKERFEELGLPPEYWS